MSRREVVILVSRAIAIIQFISAVLNVSYLPDRLFSFLHYVGTVGDILGANGYWATSYRIEIGFLFVRVIFLLVLTALFWNCGPWVESLLAPKKPEQNLPAERTRS